MDKLFTVVLVGNVRTRNFMTIVNQQKINAFCLRKSKRKRYLEETFSNSSASVSFIDACQWGNYYHWH